jgi:hypothetical protein
MKSKMFAVLIFSLVGGVASANGATAVHVKDSVGLWTGVLTGTFGGQPYYESVSLTIDQNGQHATAFHDSTIGSFSADCTLNTFADNGLASATCTAIDGPAQGLQSVVNYVLTRQGHEIALWVAAPSAGLFVSGTIFNP